VAKAVVIDDDQDVRDALRSWLEEDGWEVLEAENGEVGATVAILQMPEVIVLDVMMPVKDGYDTLAEIREDPRSGHIPIIMLTSVNDYELGSRQDADSVGRRVNVRPPEAFLEKPINWAAFKEALQDALGH